MFFALVLIAIGVIALLVQLDILSGSVWSYAWPIVLIALGLSFLWGRVWGHRRWRRWMWGPWERPAQHHHDQDVEKKE